VPEIGPFWRAQLVGDSILITAVMLVAPIPVYLIMCVAWNFRDRRCIEIDLTQAGWECVDWICVPWDVDR